MFILFQTWVQPLDGWLIDRLGPRGFITAAGVLCGLGWAGMGYATSLPMLYVLYCLAGIGAALRLQRLIGSALKWFKERRGLAAGHHGGRLRRRHGAVHPVHPVDLIGTAAISTAFLWTGIFQGVVIAVVAQFLRHPRGRRRSPRSAETSGRGAAVETETVHDARDAADAAVLRDVRRVRADGDRRTAGDGATPGRWRKRGASPMR